MDDEEVKKKRLLSERFNADDIIFDPEGKDLTEKERNILKKIN